MITWRKLGETVPGLHLYVQGSCALQRLTSPHRLSASPLQGYFLPSCNWHGSSLRLNLDATLMETHSVFSDSGEERRWYEAGQGNEDSLYPRDWLTEGCVTTVHTVRLHGLGRFCLCFPGVSTLTWKLGRGGGEEGGSQHLFTVLCESDVCPLENEVPWKVQSQSSQEAGC